MGIPNFIIAQCLTSIEEIDRQSLHQPEPFQIAVALIVKTWLAFPSCLSGKSIVAFD